MLVHDIICLETYLVAHVDVLKYYNENKHLTKYFLDLHGNRSPPFVITPIFLQNNWKNIRLSCQIHNIDPKPMRIFLILDLLPTCYGSPPIATHHSCPSFPHLAKMVYNN